MFGYWKRKYERMLQLCGDADAKAIGLEMERDDLLANVQFQADTLDDCRSMIRTYRHDDEVLNETNARLIQELRDVDLVLEHKDQEIADLVSDVTVRDTTICAMIEAEHEFKGQIVAFKNELHTARQECEMLSGSNQHLQGLVNEVRSELKIQREAKVKLLNAARTFYAEVKPLI